MAADSYVIETEFITNLHKILKRGSPQPGEWTTYGDLAEVLGDLNKSKAVGTHLMDCPNAVCEQYARRILGVGGVPSDGFRRSDRSDTRTQRQILEEEGVRFFSGRADPEARVHLGRFGPKLSGARRPGLQCPNCFIEVPSNGICGSCGDRVVSDGPVTAEELVPARHFGEIAGIPVGSTRSTRLEAAQSSCHKPTVARISGTGAEGADSIVVNGGYEDDADHGDVIEYTGAGENDPSSGKQVRDQSIDQPGIAGLITSHVEGLPVRVIRGANGDPAFSPVSGYRYDGLCRVAEHWSQVGKSGFRIWKFKLERLTDQEAAPYTPQANLPIGNQVPMSAKGVATRTARDTQVSRAIKDLYNRTCQVCECRLEFPGRAIAEGAHIRGLGGSHKGPDVPGNVLCLCPNHHALFDVGGIYVESDWSVRDHKGQLIGELVRHPAHKIDESMLAYQRAAWGYE